MSRCFLDHWEITLCIVISTEPPEHLWHRFLQSYLQIYLSYSINCQKSLKFLDSCSQQRCQFRRSHPFRLSLFFPAVSNPSERRTLLLLGTVLWAGKRDVLPAGVSKGRVELFLSPAFQSLPCAVAFPCVTKVWRKKISPEHRVLQPPAEEWPTPSASQIPTTQSWDAGICSFQFRGTSSACKDFRIIWFLSEMTTKGEQAKSAPKALFVCCSLHSHQRHGENFLRISPGDSL